MLCLTEELSIPVSGRTSPLSRIQVQEVLDELRIHHPLVTFDTTFTTTTGDIDQKTSLRTLDKTDFFTKELDRRLARGQCRITIHSAKDLPDPLAEGLEIICITKGLDPSDSLVLKQGCPLHTLPSGSVIATSSQHREDAVRTLRPDLRFVDIRGTIAQRLAQLDNGQVDGVVIAEAALIRLQLTNRNRITLPGSTTKYQGQLAVLSRKEDLEMRELFACLDTRKDRVT